MRSRSSTTAPVRRASSLDVEVDPQRGSVRLNLLAVQFDFEFRDPSPLQVSDRLGRGRDRVFRGFREARRRTARHINDLLDHRRPPAPGWIHVRKEISQATMVFGCAESGASSLDTRRKGNVTSGGLEVTRLCLRRLRRRAAGCFLPGARPPRVWSRCRGCPRSRPRSRTDRQR